MRKNRVYQAKPEKIEMNSLMIEMPKTECHRATWEGDPLYMTKREDSSRLSYTSR